MKRIIFFDVETTGLYSEFDDRIIEIGCVETINGLLTGRVFHTYLNPEIIVKKSAFYIHKINDNFLKKQKKFINIVELFTGFVNNAIVVAHNAKFDLKFINKELIICNFLIKNLRNICIVLDSLTIARKIFPRKKNNLKELCKRLHIIKKKNKIHNALDDSYLLALTMIKMGFFEKDFEFFEYECN